MMQPAAIDMFPDAVGDPERAGIVAPDAKWPANLAALVDVLHATLRGRGHDDDAALEDAQHCAIAIAEYQGGRNYYLPTGERLSNFVRDRAIYLACNGRNKPAIALRYGCTERRVEQIVAEQRAIHLRKIQPQLFDNQGETP